MTDGDWIEAERIMPRKSAGARITGRRCSGLSQLYLMTSRFVEAAETLATLTTIEPRNVLAWNMRGTASEMLMRTDDASAAFRRSLEIEPAAAPRPRIRRQRAARCRRPGR